MIERSQRDLSYSELTDPDMRASLKVGELMVVAAVTIGVPLSLPDGDKGDEWLNLRLSRIMEALRLHGDPAARSVLKEVRNQVNGSELNGDRELVLKKISSLLASLGRPQNPIKLSAIPTRS